VRRTLLFFLHLAWVWTWLWPWDWIQNIELAPKPSLAPPSPLLFEPNWTNFGQLRIKWIHQLSRFWSVLIQHEPKNKWHFGVLFEVGFVTYFGSLVWTKFDQLRIKSIPIELMFVSFDPNWTEKQVTLGSSFWSRFRHLFCEPFLNKCWSISHQIYTNGTDFDQSSKMNRTISDNLELFLK